MDGRVSTTGRTREQMVLVACARAEVTSAALERIRSLTAPPFDWDHLAGLSQQHGIWPLLLRHTLAAGAPLPAQLSSHLQRRFLEATVLNLKLTAQLAHVLDLLRRRGIPAVALKGPTLAGPVYGHLGIRPFGDLDVLVTRDTRAAACAVMRANRYRDAECYSILEGVYPGAARECAFNPTDGGGTAVEIHFDISTWPLPVSLEPSDLIARAVTVDLGGAPIRTVAPEDLVLVLAAHGTRHVWESIRHVSDIDAATRGTLDWTAVMARARETHMLRMVRVGLLLAQDLLGSEFPPQVQHELQSDRGAQDVAHDIQRRLFAPVQPAYMLLWTDSVSVRSRERVSDRVRYLARVIAYRYVIRPIDDWKSVRTHAGLWLTAKIARRLYLPLLAAALYAASLTAEPLVVGSLAATLIVGACYALSYWARRAAPIRSWSRNVRSEP